MVAAWRPDISVQCPFNADPNSSTLPYYQDMSALFLSAAAIGRGEQYELGQNQAGQPVITWLDPSEWLNPANTASPYYPGVEPMRGLLIQAMWPNTSVGNLLNPNQRESALLGTDDGGYDPTFEAYDTGSTPPWIGAAGGTTPVVTTTDPRTGSQDLTYTVAATSTPQGCTWKEPTIPGRAYTTSAYMRQSASNNQVLRVLDQTACTDGFRRTVASGWGSPDLGPAYTTTLGFGGSASVSDGTAFIGGSNGASVVCAVAGTEQDSTVNVGPLDTTAASSAGLYGRYQDANNCYSAVVSYDPAASPPVMTYALNLTLSGTGTTLATGTVAIPSDEQFTIRFQLVGPTVRMKVWRFGATEPADWTATATSTIVHGTSAGVTATAAGQAVAFEQLNIVACVEGPTVTGTGAYERMSVTWIATQPCHTLALVTKSMGSAATVNVDDIQHEQATPLGSSDGTFENGVGGWTATGGALTASQLHTYAAGGYSAQLVTSGVSGSQALVRPSSPAPITAGLPYTAMMVAYSATGFADGVHLAIDWYDGGTYKSSAVGADQVLQAGTWAVFTLSATAPADVDGASFGPTVLTPPDGTAVWFSRIFIFGQASAFTSTGPCVYGVFNGSVERWPSQWANQGFLGMCQADAVDAFEAFNLLTLDSEYEIAMAAANPLMWWPLGDSAGTTVYGETSGNGYPALTNDASKYGGLTAPAAGVDLNIPGDASGTGVAFTSQTTLNNQGTILAGGSLVRNTTGAFQFPPAGSAAGAYSAACWVQAAPIKYTGPDAQVLVWPVLPSLPAGDVTTPIGITITGSGFASVSIGGLTGTLDATGTTSILDGLPHLIVGTGSQTSSSTTADCWVDGVHVATATATTSSLGGALTTIARSLMVGGNFAYGAYEQIVNGDMAHVTLWCRVLSDDEIAALWSAGGHGNSGDLSGERVARYVGTVWRGPTAIDDGTSVMGISTLTADTPVLAACQSVAVSEQGDFFADKDGLIRFAGRQSRYLRTTSVFTFGEDTENGELPYLENLTYDFDPTYVYSRVTVTNADGVTATVSSATAATVYYPRAAPPIAANLKSDDDAIQLAYWVLNSHNQARQRVAEITLDPASHSDLWIAVLTLEIGQRVTVVRRPKAANGGVGFVMSQDYFVENITHPTIDMSGIWQATLLLSPAAESSNVWILGDTTRGVLGSTTRLAY